MDRLQDFGEPAADDTLADAPLPVSGDERRMHVRAYNYWVSLLDGAAFPSIDVLDPESSDDFGPHSVLLDFTIDPETPTIAWLGERLRTECDLPETVASVAEVPSRSLLSRLTDHHLQIIANRAPIGFEAEFVNARGNNAMYRGILLPFSSDGETIDFIYGVINWKECAPPRVVATIEEELATVAALPPSPRPMIPVWADGPSAGARSRAAGVIAEPEIIAEELRALPDERTDDVADDQASLGDRLAAARALADAAISADTRSRGALYQALSQAYDFAVEAEDRTAELDALLADSGIRAQARAPMTPVVKLIFGASYDKTRVTEFAAALSFARRRALPFGGMKLFLENFPGGLKAIVAAERRERRPEGVVARPDAAREAARALPEQAYLNLEGDDEFVVLVARRVDPARVAVVGVVPDNRALLDRVIRQIVT